LTTCNDEATLNDLCKYSHAKCTCFTNHVQLFKCNDHLHYQF
jgi:hypothetical protein